MRALCSHMLLNQNFAGATCSQFNHKSIGKFNMERKLHENNGFRNSIETQTAQ